VRGVQDGVRDARITLGQLEDIVAGRVEADKGDVLVSRTGFVGLEERDLHKMFDLGLFRLSKESRENFLPSLHVRNGAEDGLDASKCIFEAIGVGPVEIDNRRALGGELISSLTSETLVSDFAISFPNTDAHVFHSGLKQTEGDTVSNHTRSRCDKHSSQIGVESELSKTGDDISEGLSCLCQKEVGKVEFVQ